MPIARKTLRSRLASKPLLIMYMLYSEWMVTEQNQLYNKAQGRKSIMAWAPIDFTRRVATKGFIRIVGNLGGKVVSKMATRLQMGDERVMAHMD